MPLFARMGDLSVLAWLGLAENLVVDVLLQTSFIDLCSWGLLTFWPLISKEGGTYDD